MKRKALLPIIGAVCLATCVPKMTHAQVKIGANRTTIATNKNLEIEATNGKKVHVNKDDGRVYIEQRNSAVALTDSVAMMGADGELKHISVSRLTSLLIGYMDTDGDGIPNNTDTDDDGDGVLDTADNCPLAAGPSSNNGCPLITSASSNGTAVISAYTNCSLATAGTLTQGTAVSGVTQSLQVTVTTAGTYNISASANGVTFAGTGTVATGTQTIVLTATGTPLVATSGSYTLNTTPNCSFSRSAVAALSPLPSGITMTPPADYTVASVNDNNYLPYTAPTGPATTSTGVNPDATAEATAVNVQGIITTTGNTILIPYTVTGSSVSLPAFSSTITIPAEYTQDGISRDLTLSYAATTLAVGSGTISATIKAVGGTLNLKQLDINAGIGSDSKGVLAGQFTLSTNSSGATTNLGVRIIAGIPDRMFGVADNTGNTNTHKFLYIPVTAEDGKVWLNNNLGADYANVNSTSFNPAQQATSATDYKAYGSLFQWGRKPDGHELMNWTSGTTGTPVNGTTTTLSDNPTNALFITNSTSPNDWRMIQDNMLWATVASANNPCPVGFRVSTVTELNTLVAAASITNSATAASSILKFSVPGFRHYGDGTLNTVSIFGDYWSSSESGTRASYRYFGSGVTGTSDDLRAEGLSVRCIQN